MTVTDLTFYSRHLRLVHSVSASNFGVLAHIAPNAVDYFLGQSFRLSSYAKATRNMRPRFAGLDVRNSGDCYVIGRSNFFQLPRVLDNGYDHRFRKFGIRAAFSYLGGAVDMFIRAITFWSVIAKILNAVVMFNSVVMTYVHSAWSSAYKCPCNQRANQCHFLFSWFTKINKAITLIARMRRKNPSLAPSSPYRFHPPQVTDFVIAFISRNGHPIFLHAGNLNRINVLANPVFSQTN